MKGRISFVLAALYGLVWVWAAHHPYRAFFFLLLVGMMASFGIVAEGLIKLLPLILLGIAVSALTALFPPLVIVETLLLLYKAYQRRRFFFQHGVLVVIGVMAYVVIFFIPHVVLPGWVLFAAGVLLFILFCFVLKKLGYEERRTALHVLGFPGIIFLFWIATRKFSGRGRV